MRNLASDPGCMAVTGDVVTLQATWARPPATAARQRSSVARLRNADREAAEELFNACYPRLAGWVRRLVDDDETAHEIAAEAFTRLLSRWTAQDVDVRDLIESLPPRLRSAFLLHYYAGFAVKEVAMLLGRPEGTVKADLHHARARLKAAVGEAT